jgi:ABC-type Zn uptake system ZnuABC Zn-binding protein ZnuA
VRGRLLRIILLGTAMFQMAYTSGCGPSGTPTSDDSSHVDIAASGLEAELSAVSLGPNERLNVVATTNIVGDIVQKIGGDDVELTVMIPVGVDPHAFVPTPRNLAQISDADVVFANGVGLEEFLGPLLASADATSKVVYVSQGIKLLGAPAGSDDEHQAGDAHRGADPHTWTDPNNVTIWADNIERALSILDPEHTEGFRERAAVVRKELRDLDAWVRDQVSQIPQAERLIVTDHLQFAYLADRYGFEQVGTIIPGYSTTAEPSVKELADLEDTIRRLGVQSLFVGKTVNPTLAERVAQDTGTRVVLLYTGSLTEPGGEADNYVDYIRYNVSAIVNALK